jgi:hypothetical protein
MNSEFKLNSIGFCKTNNPETLSKEFDTGIWKTRLSRYGTAHAKQSKNSTILAKEFTTDGRTFSTE